jgi:hypothetical protein
MACFISSTLPPVRIQVALGAAADFAFADLAMVSSRMPIRDFTAG